ncbi:MAG: ABC transporter substrate-binding protein [Actinomycetota bacterium]|nr:ABC transporter substrate-binding protein [Actinomycetota bacterium]
MFQKRFNGKRHRSTHEPSRSSSSGRRARWRSGAAAAGAVLVAMAGGAGLLGQGAASATTSSRHRSTARHVERSSKAVSSALPSIALGAGEIFTWILPLETPVSYEAWQANVEDLMWPRLYTAGYDGKSGFDYAESIGNAPRYSNHDKTVTITMKTGYTWSTGAPVTSADVKFFFQLVDAGKKKLGFYIPGLLPDDITSVTYPSSSTFVLHLNRSYNPTWFTGNQLGWITPLPAQAWDRTSLTGPNGTAATTPAGAKQVFTFLFAQSKDRSTYPTNPLWKTVDGPFQISEYDPVTHEAQFVTNPHYTGPTRPRIAGYKVYSFTTGTAELDALRSGTVTYGYIASSDIKEASYFESHGFAIKPWPVEFNNVVELGYTSKTWGPLVKQLYVRQALQHLITENLYIKRAYGGYGVPDYGPIADISHSKYVSPQLRKDPYPFDPSLASKLLKSHGWVKGPGGVDVCKHPGTGSSDCGAGIPKGKKLSFKYLYATGTTAFFAAVSAFKTAAKSVGILLTLDGQSATTMFSTAGVCPSSPPCDWGLAGYSGYMWPYGQSHLVPIGTQEFVKGNFWAGGYTSPTANKLIEAAKTHSGLKPIYADENYLAKDVASLWWPLQDLQINCVKKTLQGWQHLSPYGTFFPETWVVK